MVQENRDDFRRLWPEYFSRERNVVAEAETGYALVDVDFHDLRPVICLGVPEDIVLYQHKDGSADGLRLETEFAG